MEYLDRLVLLGPLLAADGTGMVGSLIVIDLPDLAAIEIFLAQDPYSQAGLFESVMVHPFRQVLPEQRGMWKR
ncbi:YCII-related domain protein [invertebrate metagenome]|uniref:YCII-related domain protein n=1 Tax=invertebrate metagenome TaxID=1711999 RepID=A0A484H529_9ZZZZ